MRSDAEFNKFYYKVFPGLSLILFVEDLEEQKKGIDKKLIFKSGKTITIDEKKRRKDYGDILLEVVANTNTKKEGWLLTCQADFIVYYIEPKRKAYLLPALFLKMAWHRNKLQWVKVYKIVTADNGSYKTKSIAVPVKTLLEAISKEMQHDY